MFLYDRPTIWWRCPYVHNNSLKIYRICNFLWLERLLTIFPLQFHIEQPVRSLICNRNHILISLPRSYCKISSAAASCLGRVSRTCLSATPVYVKHSSYNGHVAKNALWNWTHVIKPKMGVVGVGVRPSVSTVCSYILTLNQSEGTGLIRVTICIQNFVRILMILIWCQHSWYQLEDSLLLWSVSVKMDCADPKLTPLVSALCSTVTWQSVITIGQPALEFQTWHIQDDQTSVHLLCYYLALIQQPSS